MVRGEQGDELWICGHGRWGQLGGKKFDHISEPKLVSTLSRLRQYDEAQRQARHGDRHAYLIWQARHDDRHVLLTSVLFYFTLSSSTPHTALVYLHME